VRILTRAHADHDARGDHEVDSGRVVARPIPGHHAQVGVEQVAGDEYARAYEGDRSEGFNRQNRVAGFRRRQPSPDSAYFVG